MRKPMVAGNWKMNGLRASVANLVEGIKKDHELYSAIDIVVFPTYLHLAQVQELLQDTTIALGAQNLYLGESGAFTGEVSGTMLADIGCRYVLVGHSERRSIFGEDSAIVASKFQAALDARLHPILCVGETLKQRERGETEKVLHDQIETVVNKAGISAFRQAVIAYEPVWAIGTGLTATPEQAQAAHTYIRSLLAEHDVDIAPTIRILYGGSLKADNAPQLFAMPDIDGGLIGGASLEAKSFLAICREALAVKLGQDVI
ncbi:MAG TPA: triose-phosphate isomerase [Gammaproteobacteria bacterium]|nr:triose-phosphate isomerase [Gammaproteobacteria bacterium]